MCVVHWAAEMLSGNSLSWWDLNFILINIVKDWVADLRQGDQKARQDSDPFKN